MDFSPHRDACFLNADEASAIEAAVRTAFVSILKVFCDVNDKRSRCYEAKLAEAERENAALKFQLTAAEQELQTLRRISSKDDVSAQVTFSASVEERVEEEETAAAEEEEGEGEETAPEEEEGEETAAAEEEEGEETAPEEEEATAVLVLKEEEPFYESSLFIKSEKVTEGCSAPILNPQHPGVENAQIQTHRTHNNNHHNHHHHHHNHHHHHIQQQQQQRNHSDPVLTGLERRRLTRYETVRRYRERIRADPVKYLAWKEKNHLRYLQNRKTIDELPEPLKKLQRKAWREATRRHRAKKLAQAALPAASMSPSVTRTCFP